MDADDLPVPGQAEIRLDPVRGIPMGPIIDRTKSFSNVHIAAGHNMLGLSMAPATGKLIAGIIAGNKPHIDPHPYRASRF